MSSRMATRAETARAAKERETAKNRSEKKEAGQSERAKAPGRVARAKKSASGRWVGGKGARRNVMNDDGKKATFALEDAPVAKTSRKSTRKSANRMKPDSNLRRREMRRDAAPKTRAAKAARRSKAGRAGGAAQK
jgi:hypothetical protein